MTTNDSQCVYRSGRLTIVQLCDVRAGLLEQFRAFEAVQSRYHARTAALAQIQNNLCKIRRSLRNPAKKPRSSTADPSFAFDGFEVTM